MMRGMVIDMNNEQLITQSLCPAARSIGGPTPGRDVLSYVMAPKKNQSLNVQVSVLNIAANNDVSAGVSWLMKF